MSFENVIKNLESAKTNLETSVSNNTKSITEKTNAIADLTADSEKKNVRIAEIVSAINLLDGSFDA